MQDRIPREKLCQTLLDAIQITRQLGFRYLWIDSLCIVQHDPQDWRQEATKMGSVYGCSSLNIAAASAVNGTIGCFFNRSEEVLRYARGLRVNLDGGPPQMVHEPDLYQTSVTQGPLSRRPWVLQEHVLSPRIIWFSERGLFWECRENTASEIFQSELPDHQSLNRNIGNLSARWYRLVEDYSRGNLTYDSDKLIAISGLAQAV